jgi:replicative DNA helicase
MSDERDMSSAVEELREEARQAVDLAEKEKLIRRKRTERMYKQELESEAELDRLSKIDILKLNPEHLEKMDREHDLTVLSMNSRLPFVNDILTDIVPYNYPNLILLGAKSGEGKTSFTSAAVLALLKDGKRVLIISNEEMSVNYYNRVIALNKGWNINDLKSFTPEQHAELKRMRALMYNTGRLRVIDSDFNDMKNATRTVEGVKFIFEQVLQAQNDAGGVCPFDAIYLDYYQNCGTSTADPRKRRHEVLEDLSKFLDDMYKKVHAPVTVLSQMKPESKEESGFEFRIKESKSIFVPSTFALELIPDKARRMTKFIVHKHRWSSRAGEAVELGFDRGHYVEYTMDFQQRVAEINEQREHRKQMQKVLKNIDERKKEE